MPIELVLEYETQQPPRRETHTVTGPLPIMDYSNIEDPRALVIMPRDSNDGADIYSMDPVLFAGTGSHPVESRLYDEKKIIGHVVLGSEFSRIIQPQRQMAAKMVVRYYQKQV